jgi:hypothetical protein
MAKMAMGIDKFSCSECSRELISIGRDIIFYMYGSEFEPRYPLIYLKDEISNHILYYLTKKNTWKICHARLDSQG